MSKNGSNQEGLLNYFLYKHPEELENILKVKFKVMELEKRFKDRKGAVDFFAVTDDGRLVLVELQRNKSDRRHIEQILSNIELIQQNEYGLIVWIATEFNMEFLNKVENEIKGKSIDFFAIRLNDAVNPFLDYLNSIHRFESTKQIDMLSFVNRMLKLEKSVLANVSTYVPVLYNNSLDLSKVEGKLLFIDRQIKREVDFYYKLLFDRNVTSNYISIGAGRSDCSYKLFIKNNRVGLELMFNHSSKSCYLESKKDKEKILSDFDYLLKFDDAKYKIAYYSYLQNTEDDERVLKQMARMFVKVFKYFESLII